MELIEKQAAMNCCFKPQVRPNEEIFNALKMAIRSEISAVPSVLAVPLDKLCEWLGKQGMLAPCYFDQDCDKCELKAYWQHKKSECWKHVLTKWMEGLDAADKR